MKMYKLKVGETAVYDEAISITLSSVLSKYVWLGNVFYMPYFKNQIYIPANQNGWKWILDENETGIQQSTLRLYSGEGSHSYVALHFNKLDPAPHPLTFSLNMPEFLGNFVGVIVSDEGEREKSLIHPMNDKLDIGSYTVCFKDLNNKKVSFEIHNNIRQDAGTT
jgi:hypothetical protein